MVQTRHGFENGDEHEVRREFVGEFSNDMSAEAPTEVSMPALPMEDVVSWTGIYAALEHGAKTTEALALAERLTAAIVEHETTSGARAYKRGGVMLTAFQEAVGRFAADLLRATASPHAEGRCFRSMMTEKFKGVVSYKHFKAIVTTMEALGLITRVAGFRKGSRSAFAEKGARDAFYLTESRAATFKATPTLLDLAAAAGVSPETVGQHFEPDVPGDLIVLRAGRLPTIGEKEKGAIIDFRGQSRWKHLRVGADAIEAELEALNEFMAGFTLTGATHSGFYRTFNLGDHPDFAWNKGGRIISRGVLQNLDKEKRLEITIDGDPVTEIDVEASHLTLAYGLLGVTTESTRGAYEVEGLPSLVVDDVDWRRWAVKTWTTVSFGADKPMTRWPGPQSKKFKARTGRDLGKVFRPSEVAKVMLTKHPVLADWWSKKGSWADLQYAESQALIGTMTALMKEPSIPSFPIHDSILVRTKDFGHAREALSDSYRRLCSFRPSLVWRHGTTITASPS